MKQIGLFGGTFDPVHIGHLIVAQSVLEQLGLDTVLFIPSAHPPHKRTDIMFSPEERFSMLALAIQGNPHFHISDIEMNRRGPSYTIDTIRQIKSTMSGDTSLSFIIGRDNLFDISTWKEPRAIIEECRIIIADRPVSDGDSIPEWLMDSIELVRVPLIEISSSGIRARIRAGISIRYLVPDAALDIFEKKKKNSIRYEFNNDKIPPVHILQGIKIILILHYQAIDHKRGCDFCYRNATPDGKHLPIVKLRYILEQIKNQKLAVKFKESGIWQNNTFSLCSALTNTMVKNRYLKIFT